VDFDIRQWLLILGPIFIAGVLVHGYFRMRSGQNDIKMKLDRGFLSRPGENHVIDELSLFKAELPNGGARLVGIEAGAVIPGDDVPVLVESVEGLSISAISSAELSKLDVVPEASRAHTPEPIAALEEPEKAPPGRKAFKIEEDQPTEKTVSRTGKPEMFVVIYVLAVDEPFLGQALVDILQDSGMTFGEMDIYHQLDEGAAQLFSLASAVEPGAFKLSSIDQFSTPGVSLFMRVHELATPLQVLDSMLSVANTIAQELNGEVRDETRSVMTPQTKEHCRQSITEFLFTHSA
jgi:cell division protein ZipA